MDNELKEHSSLSEEDLMTGDNLNDRDEAAGYSLSK